MPALSTIATIATIASAAMGIGTSVYSMTNQPGSPAAADPATMTKQAIDSETQRRQMATKQAGQLLPDLNAQTSGFTSSNYLKDTASALSGNADLSSSGQFQEMMARFMGTDKGSSFGGGGSTFGSGTGFDPSSPGLKG